MTFYSYDYLVNQTSTSNHARIAIVVVIALLACGSLLLFLRSRDEVKYRDLSIIGFVGLAAMGFIALADYQSSGSRATQLSDAAEVVEDAADRLGVSRDEAYLSSPSQPDGALMTVEGQFYRIEFSDDGKDYVLEKVRLVSPNATFQEAE